MSRLLFAVLILLAASQSQAGVKLYGEARLGAGGVRHSGLDFYPRFSSASVGVFVYNNIGIEAFASSSLSSDEKDGFVLDVTESSGAALRFQSPPKLGGLQAYILIGYVAFALQQKENGIVGPRTVKWNYEGVRVAVGVHQRLTWLDGLIFGLEYRNDNADSGITVDGLSLGLRYEMR